MRRKRHSWEEIVNKLREAVVRIAKGQTVAQAFKHFSVRCNSHSEYPAGSRKSQALHVLHAILSHNASMIRRLVSLPESWTCVAASL